jgi:transposase
MSESTTVTVGLDVYARSIRLAAVRAEELLEERTLPHDEEQVERLLRRWPGVRCCYEAGPTGFGLYRHLVGRGIDCSVVAPGLVPQRPGDRVKTDPRDARKLARLHAGGLLEPIYVPSRELEAARDLVRAREDARLDRMRDRQRLSKFCLRHGRLLPTTAWTVTRRAWLGQQRFERAAAQLTFDTYLHAVDLVDHRIDALEQAIREVAARGPWRQLVARLRCLRGVDTHTALALVAEIGDFGRFASAEEFMAFVGLVPSERSSGEQRRQGSITKVGNAHVRRLLVESAWHARRRPTVGYQLARRQRGQDAIVIERAWRLPAATAPALAADGRTRQTAAKDRRRLRPRARRLRLGDRHRSTTQESLIQPLGLEQRMRPTTRRTLAAPMRHRPPVTRDLRPRQLPTVPLHAVPTRECQSDPPSLLRTIRCSRPRAQPHLPSRT